MGMSYPSCSFSPARCLPCVTLPLTHPHWELNGHFPPLLLLLLGCVYVFEQKGNLVGQRSVSSAMSLPCLSFLYLRLSHDRFGQRQFASPGYLDTLHLLSTAHPTTNRLLLGLSLLCSPRRQLSQDPSSLAPKDRAFSGFHPTTSLTWAPAPRLAGSPDPRSSNDPPVPRSLAAQESQAWSKRRRLAGCGGCDGSPKGSKLFVPATPLPSHPSERHRVEHRLEAATLRLSLAIWEP